MRRFGAAGDVEKWGSDAADIPDYDNRRADLLAAALGEAMAVTPPVSGLVGGLTGANLIVRAMLAGLTLAAGLAFAKPGVMNAIV